MNKDIRSTIKQKEKKAIRKQITSLAIPNIISNITVPLLSLVDVGLAGHLPSTSSIGAVAIASGAMNTIFWLFSFLRMGTTGYVAQAFGQQNKREQSLFLIRGIAFALSIGILLIFTKPLLLRFALFMAQGEVNIANDASVYLEIALMGAPAAMLLYIFNGWFIGMQNSRIPMISALSINVFNIVASFFLVNYGGMGIKGLALGTVLAQYIGVLLLLLLAKIYYTNILQEIRYRDILSKNKLKEFILLGKDVFFRSFLISSVTLFFTYSSVGRGENLVSANTLLLQFFTLFSYFTDGLAYAGEALTGRFIGMKSPHLLKELVRQLFRFGFLLAFLCSIIYGLFPKTILSILSDKKEIIEVAIKYHYWVSLIPLVGFSAFLWDGVFVGATYSRGLMLSMFSATILFFLCYRLLHNQWGNNALWFSFISYLGGRGAMQYYLWYQWKMKNL